MYEKWKEDFSDRCERVSRAIFKASTFRLTEAEKRRVKEAVLIRVKQSIERARFFSVQVGSETSFGQELERLAKAEERDLANFQKESV